jgi:antitoxin component of MazEF toxin-antitoxin module
MRKLQGSKNGSYLVGIPSRFVKALGLNKSDLIKLELNPDNKIIMERVNL